MKKPFLTLYALTCIISAPPKINYTDDSALHEFLTRTRGVFDARKDIQGKIQEAAKTGDNKTLIAYTHVMHGNTQDLDATDEEGRTPLMYALMNGHAACAITLLYAGANSTLPPPPGEVSALFYAIALQLRAPGIAIRAEYIVTEILKQHEFLPVNNQGKNYLFDYACQIYNMLGQQDASTRICAQSIRIINAISAKRTQPIHKPNTTTITITFPTR